VGTQKTNMQKTLKAVQNEYKSKFGKNITKEEICADKRMLERK
jgi:hypothetical protein